MNRALQGIGGGGAPSLQDFMRSMTPERAKAEVERLVAEGKVDRGRLDELSKQAQALARGMGLI